MAFKYVNPGYGSLLDHNWGTNASSFYSQHCTTGLCFSQTTRGKNIDFPDGIKEIWIKVWTYNADSMRMYIDDANCTGFRAATDINVWNNNTLVTTFSVPEQRDGKEHVWLLHFKSDADNGIFEIFNDGIRYYKSGGNVYGGKDIKYFELRSDYGSDYFSGIIAADYDISNEKIAVLPMSDPVMDGFEKSGDNYVATAEGASIKRTVNKDSLISKIGGKSLIKSVSIFSIPCYANDDTLNKVTTFVEEGENSVDVESTTLVMNSTSSTASQRALYSRPMQMNPVTGKNWSLDELDAVSLGIRTTK